MDFIKLLLTSLLSVISLFIITKFMGHKQVAQLDFFDYISGITIGSIGAEMATDLKAPWQSFTALAIYGAFSLFLNFLTQKIPKTRKYINGSPTILMHEGKIYYKNLKKSKLDLSEFLLLCREQGYFQLSEIQTAIFEHNGKLSILPSELSRPVTPSDININPPKQHISTEIIMDGEIMGENLKRIGKSEKWLLKKIRSQGYKEVNEILLGLLQEESDSISLYPYK